MNTNTLIPKPTPMTAASEHPLLYDRPQKLNVPQLKEVAQEVEDTIVKIMKEAPSG